MAYQPEIEEDEENLTGDYESVEEMDEEELQGYVSTLLEDAINYCDELGQDRVTATKYFSGELPQQDDEGRSAVTSFDTRDTVMAILPSLMRVFFGADKIMQFVPKGPEDVELSEQCSDYINNLILEQQPDFFNTMLSVFKDALIRRTGVLKYWHEETETVTSSIFTGLDEQQIQILAGEDDVIDVEMEQKDQTPEGIPLFDVTLKRRIKSGKIRIEALPGEEFLISRTAKSIEDADIVSHRSYKTISELVSLGYSKDDLEEYATTDESFSNNQEYANRHSDNATRTSQNMEPNSRRILYCENFCKIDKDRDNYSELLRVCTLSSAHTIVNVMPCDQIPFVLFTPDPTPHISAVAGSSITDQVADIQRIKSAILRSTMDSLVMAVNPRMMVQEGQVNMSDVLNTEVGSIIRARTPGAVSQLSMPFVGQASLPILAMLDEIKASRTGITKISQGLDVESLTSTARVGIDASVKAAQAHIEMIARIFAETGMKPLYKGILKLVIKHQDRMQMARLNNRWIPIDPRYWDADADITVDIPLGGGNDIEKMQFLTTIAQKQEQLLKQFGPENPIVNLRQYHHTLSRMVTLSGFKDPSVFFTDPASYKPPPKKEPDPPSAEEIQAQFVQIQGKKIMADSQNDAARLELDREKMVRLDDREKDRIESQAELSIMEMEAKYNTQMDGAKVKAIMERDREQMKVNAALLQAQLSQQQAPPPMPPQEMPPQIPQQSPPMMPNA